MSVKSTSTATRRVYNKNERSTQGAHRALSYPRCLWVIPRCLWVLLNGAAAPGRLTWRAGALAALFTLFTLFANSANSAAPESTARCSDDLIFQVRVRIAFLQALVYLPTLLT